MKIFLKNILQRKNWRVCIWGQKVRLGEGSKGLVPIEDNLLEDQDLVLEIQDIMASSDHLNLKDHEQEITKTIGIAIIATSKFSKIHWMSVW